MSRAVTASANGPRVAWDWALVVVGLAVAVLGFSYRGSPPAAGSVVEADFTLVPRDARNLSCASDRAYGTFRCAFAANGARGPMTDRPIVPAVTVTRELFFAAGLFQDPALTAYLASPAGRRSARFTAACKVQLVERASDIRVRFGGTNFSASDPAWVADVLSCQIKTKAPGHR